MAITKVTTPRGMNTAHVPPGYSYPAITALTGKKFTKVDTYTVSVAGLEDADALTGFQQIVAQVDTYMDTYADTELHLDAADTITLHCYIRSIKRPPQVSTKLEEGVEIYQNDGNDEYVVTFRVEWQ